MLRIKPKKVSCMSDVLWTACVYTKTVWVWYNQVVSECMEVMELKKRSARLDWLAKRTIRRAKFKVNSSVARFRSDAARGVYTSLCVLFGEHTHETAAALAGWPYNICGCLHNKLILRYIQMAKHVLAAAATADDDDFSESEQGRAQKIYTLRARNWQSLTLEQGWKWP
jgi:hypothetical protein